MLSTDRDSSEGGCAGLCVLLGLVMLLLAFCSGLMFSAAMALRLVLNP
jgi:hypothetical protein